MKKSEAMTDRHSGERPNKAMVAPDARPGYFGKCFEAAKIDEKYLINIHVRFLGKVYDRRTRIPFQDQLLGRRR